MYVIGDKKMIRSYKEYLSLNVMNIESSIRKIVFKYSLNIWNTLSFSLNVSVDKDRSKLCM